MLTWTLTSGLPSDGDRPSARRCSRRRGRARTGSGSAGGAPPDRARRAPLVSSAMVFAPLGSGSRGGLARRATAPTTRRHERAQASRPGPARAARAAAARVVDDLVVGLDRVRRRRRRARPACARSVAPAPSSAPRPGGSARARTGGISRSSPSDVGEEPRHDQQHAGDQDQRAVRDRPARVAAGLEAGLQPRRAPACPAGAPARCRRRPREARAPSVGSTPDRAADLDEQRDLDDRQPDERSGKATSPRRHASSRGAVRWTRRAPSPYIGNVTIGRHRLGRKSERLADGLADDPDHNSRRHRALPDPAAAQRARDPRRLREAAARCPARRRPARRDRLLRGDRGRLGRSRHRRLRRSREPGRPGAGRDEAGRPRTSASPISRTARAPPTK